MSDGIWNRRDLQVWQRAMELVVACYTITRRFPDSERLGLSSQIQRAAVSVPSNIAEGRSRGSRKVFANFLWIANGSLAELDTQIDLANRLEYISADQAKSLDDAIEIIGRMTTNLRRSLGQES